MRCLVGIVFILTERLKAGTWFRFMKVDMEIPKPFWPKFEDMLLFFYDRHVPVEPVPQHRKDYLQHTDRKRGNGKKLVGALSAQKVLLYAPLLLWYVEHRAGIKESDPSSLQRAPTSVSHPPFSGPRFSEVCSRWKKSSIRSWTRRNTDILRPRFSQYIRL